MNPPGVLRAWLWTGTEFEPAEAIPVGDRGFRYGMSVFESFPLHSGFAPFLEAHLARLRHACDVTGFSVPVEALDACEPILRQGPDGFARIYITAGDGPVTAPYDRPRVLILVEPRQRPTAKTYHRGYDLALHAGNHVPLFPGLKTGNYWSNLRSFREGVAGQCNETLLFTLEGLLISACMANVFIAKDGRVTTPDLSTGARPGVVREWVMQNTEVAETHLTRAEVESADEIFLTSSWLGIMPAASIQAHPLRERKLSAGLLPAYRTALESR